MHLEPMSTVSWHCMVQYGTAIEKGLKCHRQSNFEKVPMYWIISFLLTKYWQFFLSYGLGSVIEDMFALPEFRHVKQKPQMCINYQPCDCAVNPQCRTAHIHIHILQVTATASAQSHSTVKTSPNCVITICLDCLFVLRDTSVWCGKTLSTTLPVPPSPIAPTFFSYRNSRQLASSQKPQLTCSPPWK